MTERRSYESLNSLNKRRQCCSARTTLWYLIFTGTAINYMFRINLNMAIISMVAPKDDINDGSISSECFNIGNNSNITILKGMNLNESSIPESTINKIPKVVVNLESNIEFDWNETVQGIVLGSFFWLHWITQLPGGILAGRYGTKLVFGLANLFGVLTCLGIPYCARLGYSHLVGLRLFQGFVGGFAFPSLNHLIGKWIPPNERSKFVTAYLGSSVGTALTYPLCGLIIDLWSWEYIFYATTITGVIWFCFWWGLVYDSPDQHPRISDEEKNYILESLGNSVSNEARSIPWQEILTSKDVWLNITAQFGTMWGFYTLMTYAPTYFKFIHGWGTQSTGMLSGAPHLLRIVWAFLFSIFGDYLMSSERMSRTNVRKLATGFCCIGQALFMLLLAYSGCNSSAAIVFLTIAVTIQGSMSTGPLASAIDISPNYGSIIMGLSNTGSAIVGFLTPAVTGFLTYQNQTSTQWQKVYWVATVILLTSGLLYSIFAKSELKSWNSPTVGESRLEENEKMVDVDKTKILPKKEQYFFKG